MKLKKRLIPKIRFTNYHKLFPITRGIWNEWFKCQRMWGGSIVEIRVKHYQLSLDFRKNWMKDMLYSNEKEYKREKNV